MVRKLNMVELVLLRLALRYLLRGYSAGTPEQFQSSPNESDWRMTGMSVHDKDAYRCKFHQSCTAHTERSEEIEDQHNLQQKTNYSLRLLALHVIARS